MKKKSISLHGTPFNPKGFDIKGYDKEGYNERGYNRNGYDREGYNKDGYDKEGYDRKGYDKKGYDRKGFDRKGYNRKTRSRYDMMGYDKNGYNKQGYDKEGYDREGYSWLGFNKQGRDKEGYDMGGFDIDGINREGFDIKGFYYEKQEKGVWKNTGKKRDPEGFDVVGINERGFNREKFFHRKLSDGTWENSYSLYDDEGYDIYNCDRNGIQKGSHVNKFGFDSDGIYWEKDQEGKFVSTGLKYNRRGFNCDEKHVITKSRIDLRHFDINGRCKENNDSIYDKEGFKQDGTYMETGEKYHNGYNAFGIDKNGRDKKGRIHPDITFAEGYIDAIMRGKRISYLEEKCEINSRNKDKVMEDVNIIIYRASEMYPELKKKIIVNIYGIQKIIKQREKRITEIQGKTSDEEAEIKKLQKENKILKQRISSMDPMQDMEEVEK